MDIVLKEEEGEVIINPQKKKKSRVTLTSVIDKYTIMLDIKLGLLSSLITDVATRVQSIEQKLSEFERFNNTVTTQNN